MREDLAEEGESAGLSRVARLMALTASSAGLGASAIKSVERPIRH